MGTKKRIVIVGATSLIAEHCARLWLKEQSIDLTLIGRNASRMERIAADLQVRSPSSEIHIVQAEFLDPHSIQKTVDTVAQKGSIDLILIAHGALPEQTDCQKDLSICHDALSINGISPILFAEAFATHLIKLNYGTLILIGSVAGDRGRRSNYIYGAAKAMISSYAQGLQHRVASSKVKVILIKPGPTDTPMTSHLKERGIKLASVEAVAKIIVDSAAQVKTVVYAPKKWQLIMCIIRNIPTLIFNKMNI